MTQMPTTTQLNDAMTNAYNNGRQYALYDIEDGSNEPLDAPLSGEFSDDPTTVTVAADAGYPSVDYYALSDDERDIIDYDMSVIADSWESGYYDAWSNSAEGE